MMKEIQRCPLRNVLARVGVLSSMALFAASPSLAQTADTIPLPQVAVVGQDERRVFKNVPGTVNILSSQDLKAIVPIGAADAVRKMPGLNVLDEDPASLRLNIGVRGLYPTRTSRILVLEDGVPITLNPYGEPALYFSPLIDKMDGVELLKSSGQLLFGPQTIGGVINFVTANPPEEMTTRVKLNAGGGGFFSGFASHGNTVGNAGYLLTYNHKRADNLGPLGFTVNDVSGKFNYAISDRSQLGFKIGYFGEESNSTYVGITQAMYDQGGYDQETIAKHDLMLIDKYNASLTHNYKINGRVQLQTNAFAYYIRRNWRRQDFDNVPSASRTYERIIGDPNLTDGGSIFFRETSRWRNRQYVVKGVEPRFNVRHGLFNVANTLKTGVRALWETAYEQAIHTSIPDAFNGDNRNNEERNGFAASAYAVNEFQVTGRFSANVGVRIEHYGMKRELFNANDDNTDITHRRDVFAFIPGAGLNFVATESITLFAGVHKGFAPPELKSALDASGAVDEIDKEESINYELGARLALGNYLHFSPTLFYMDFKNQQIPVMLATAGSGFANGGKSRHIGGEFGVDFDLAEALGSEQSVVVGGSFTYTDARFADDGDVTVEGDVVERVVDNFLPYAPKIVFNNYVGANLTNGLGLRVSGNYVGKQYQDGNNTEEPTPNGLTGALASRYILEGTVFYTLNNKFTFNVSAKNLTNARYIASRSPQGIRVGLDRFVTAGIDFTF